MGGHPRMSCSSSVSLRCSLGDDTVQYARFHT